MKETIQTYDYSPYILVSEPSSFHQENQPYQTSRCPTKCPRLIQEVLHFIFGTDYILRNKRKYFLMLFFFFPNYKQIFCPNIDNINHFFLPLFLYMLQGRQHLYFISTDAGRFFTSSHSFTSFLRIQWNAFCWDEQLESEDKFMINLQAQTVSQIHSTQNIQQPQNQYISQQILTLGQSPYAMLRMVKSCVLNCDLSFSHIHKSMKQWIVILKS